MRALSPLKKLASAHPSRRLSPASKYSLSSCVKTWLDTGPAHVPALPSNVRQEQRTMATQFSIHDWGEICLSYGQLGFSDQTETWNKESHLTAIRGTIFLFFRRPCSQ